MKTLKKIISSKVAFATLITLLIYILSFQIVPAKSPVETPGQKFLKTLRLISGLHGMDLTAPPKPISKPCPPFCDLNN